MAALPRSSGTSASQCFSFNAASRWSAAARKVWVVIARYSTEVCTQATALRLSCVPVGLAWVAAAAGAAGSDGMAAGSVRLHADRVSNEAARPAASRETRMRGPVIEVPEF